ncbi:hypothetical protein NPS70_16515 [Streptomyces sp. C10-9-1]|uniref:hypothetical protein n=1 Tax=Streptomyces sp. C10-9-1 TaxID=1859285 RepID=UPI00211176D7|nr:hypothetical protein [Streptomyces sp. C10-9-1]MCQ6554790.1 hypothetical protein [Streptomyces sp. C10-9-1]
MSVVANLLPFNTQGIETDTSGWAAGANTSQVRSTTRWYSGSASLQLTATAAGTVQSTTAARVAVTAGLEYTAYAYWANVAPASGRTTQVRLDWYDVVSGGTPLSSDTSVATAMPSGTAAWITPPTIVIATAPAGATYVSVTVLADNVSAGGQVVVDQIFMGHPNHPTGNLLPYNTGGVEVDTSGWTGTFNCTVSRTTATSWEGWYSLVLTSSAAGTMAADMTTAVPVLAGTEYIASARVKGSVAADFVAELRFFDVGDTYLESAPAVTWSPSTSDWTYVATIGVAPAGAVSATIRFSPSPSAAAQEWTIDRIAILVAPALTGSLISYGAQSMEVTADDWEVVEGCTLARSTTRAWEGSASLEVTPTGGTAHFQMTAPVPVEPRQPYKIAPYLYRPATAEPLVVDMCFAWEDEGGNPLGLSYFRWTLGTLAGWYAPVGTAVPPSGAAAFTPSIRVWAADPADGVMNVDHIYVGPGGFAAIADPIAGAFGARIAVQGLTQNANTTWGIWRLDAGGQMTSVRGYSGDLDAEPITGDLAVVEDYEAPLGVPVRYYVKAWTSPESYTATSSLPVTLMEPPSTDVVLTDPGQPARQTTATVQQVPDWTRVARQGVAQVRGRTLPVVISDVRGGRTGTLTLVTETTERRDAMWWLLDTGSTILVQWPAAWGERDVYVQVGDVTESRIVRLGDVGDRTWAVPLTEVDRPIGGISGSSSRTWEDVSTEDADWAGVLRYASWLDVYIGPEV